MPKLRTKFDMTKLTVRINDMHNKEEILDSINIISDYLNKLKNIYNALDK